MHENETSKGSFIEPLNSQDSQQPPRMVSCPFYTVVPDENIFDKPTKNLPLLAPAKSEQPLEVIPPLEFGDAQTIIELELDKVLPLDELEYAAEAIQSESVAHSDSDETDENSEFEKLLTLNQELQSANSQLYERVSELTSALSESETALHQNIKRLSVRESMFNQQTQELSAAQEQIKLLFEQMENAVQTTQRQGSLIESYKNQLEVNQQRLAHLERECTLIQTKYNEQTHQLQQSENSCRELRTRLKRQQRQTLQFKAALEKCLDSPVPSYDESDTWGDRHHTVTPPSYPQKNSALNSFKGRIQPWSGENNPQTNSNKGKELLAYSTSEPPTAVSTSTSMGEFSPAENTDKTTSETHPVESTDFPNACQIDPPEKFDTEYKSDVQPLSTDLQQQLDSVIETFFANKSPQNPPPEPEPNNSINSIPVWKTIMTPFENEPTWGDRPMTFSVDDHWDRSPTTNPDPNDETTEDYSTEVSQFPSSEWDSPNPNIPLGSFDNQFGTNSPSPVVYPQRRPKGRKSLASVELPNFRPQQSGS